MTIIHRVQEEAEKLAEWFGLSEREVNWVRTAKAGNDEDGYSEALLGIDEEGWFPLRVRASGFETDVITDGLTKDPRTAERAPESESEAERVGIERERPSAVQTNGSCPVASFLRL